MAMRTIHTILSLDLNLVIERLGLDSRWKYAVWMLIALNEIRGLCTVYGFVKVTGVM